MMTSAIAEVSEVTPSLALCLLAFTADLRILAGGIIIHLAMCLYKYGGDKYVPSGGRSKLPLKLRAEG